MVATTTRFAHHLLPAGDHASRPDPEDVPEGTLYPCTDHGVIDQSDGVSVWTEWHDPSLSPPGSHTHDGADVATGTIADARVASTIARDSEVAAAVTGLLDFKGSTDCSANPNYPAGSKGDAYLVSVAGKIGGASGIAVDVGDVYVASADNAGGTQAGVGSSWFLLEHNMAGVYLAGGTDVPVADGGTGSSTASGARANLGLALGSDIDARVMTTQDDLIVGGASGAAARLGKGTDGQVLTVDPTTHHLVWATPSGGGGGGSGPSAIKSAYLGKDAIGASHSAVTAHRVYAKRILATADGFITSVDWYGYINAGGNTPYTCVAVLADNAGVPGVMISETGVINPYQSSGGAGAPRWSGMPVKAKVAAGTYYWIAVIFSGAMDLYHDAGTDHYWTQSFSTGIADGGVYTDNTSSLDYSLRALFEYASGTTPLARSVAELAADVPMTADAAYHDVTSLTGVALGAGTYRAVLTVAVVPPGADTAVAFRVTDGTSDYLVADGLFKNVSSIADHRSWVSKPFTLTVGATFKAQYLTGGGGTVSKLSAAGGNPNNVIVSRLEFEQLPDYQPTPPAIVPNLKGLWWGANGVVGANSTPTANEAHYLRITVPYASTPTRIGLPINVSSGNLDLGIYADDGTGLNPGAKIATLGSTASPGTGRRVFTIAPGALSPGVYWLAFVADNGTISFQYTGAGTGNGGGGPQRCLRQSAAFPLPATAGAGLSEQSWGAAVWVEVA